MNHDSCHRLRPCCAIVCLLTALSRPVWSDTVEVSFNRDVRPILSETCFQCHGPDSGQRQADLRLDRKDGLFRERDEVRVVVPSDVERSELMARISSTDPDIRMPPPSSPRQLTVEQREIIRRWIEQGAPWKSHWSYLPPTQPRVPETAGPDDSVIDAFVQKRLTAAGLQPVSAAEPFRLIRRISFDLTGLPPTPQEVAKFTADYRTDPQTAWHAAVDSKLQSPHFGERMAIYWLDLVRYADTNGIHGDNHREVSLYRDYVIDSFNDNKPFDQFTVEQLAGDLLPGAGNTELIASGYNRLLMTTREGGAQPKEYLAKYSADRVRNASSVWMGATLACAECHDHKFDPYSTRDFYSFAAFFADIDEVAVGTQPPTKIPSAEQQERRKVLQQNIAAFEQQLREQTPQLDAARKELQTFEESLPTMLVSNSVEPRVIRVLPRGNWLDESGEIVEPAVPHFLPQLQSESRASRLDLARWFVSADNPLTARVFVNRLWMIMFGEGLVRSADDFGSQGAWPTHPDLLDWLAVEFINSGWDVKHIIRQIALSNAYRRSSLETPQLRTADPFNRWLARQSRFRFDAEVIRDNALAVSGLLVSKIGGPSVKPYQPAGYWAHLNFPQREWMQDSGDALYRRSVYTYWCRTFLHPGLQAFDAPTREECCVKRSRSNNPLQALVLLNDPTYVEAARTLAKRLLTEFDGSTAERLQQAVQLVLSRTASEQELATLEGVYHRQLLHHQQAAAEAASSKVPAGSADATADNAFDSNQLDAWTAVSRVLLNLHETITRY